MIESYWKDLETTEGLENTDSQESVSEQWEIPWDELARRMALANKEIAKALRWNSHPIKTPFLTF